MNAKTNTFTSRIFSILTAVLIAVLIFTPTVAADQVSLSVPQPAPNHLITFIEVEQVDNGWKWVYEIESVGPPAISHVDFYLCVPQDELVQAYDPAGNSIEWSNGTLKFDNGYNDYETRQVWFILSAYHLPGNVSALIKAANSELDRTVTGPTCDPAPEAVELASFTAEAAQGGVLIKWETGSEINNLGFNIYRNTLDEIESASIINEQFIPSQASGSLFGTSYEYLDTTAESGVYYHYWLEDVEASGNAQGTDLFLMGIHNMGRMRWTMPQTSNVNAGDGPINYKDPLRIVGVFKDMDKDLGSLYLLINDSPTAEGGVLVRYNALNNTFAIYDETISDWLPGIAPLQKTSLQSQAANLRGAKSVVQTRKEGKVSRVTWNIKFRSEFVGTHNVYLMAEDASGNSTGWQFYRTITIQ